MARLLKKHLSNFPRFKTYGEPIFTHRCCAHTSKDGLVGAHTHEDKFILPQVQDLLCKITGFDVDRIFKPRYGSKSKESPPKYKLVTNHELDVITSKANEKGRKLLQMPPVLKERENQSLMISNDPEISGLYSFRFVFTDISQGVKKRKRNVVIREADGVLRTARPDEHDRMMQVYFPEPGRMYKVPSMLSDDFLLQQCLDNGNYLYVLDRLCVQFEPDDPHYIKVRNVVYDHIDKMNVYETLISTRHFGGLSYHLCSTKNIDGLIIYFLQQDRLEEAVIIITLYNLLHNDSTLADIDKDRISNEEVIRLFAQKESRNGGSIELALQSYLDSLKSMKSINQ